MSLMIFFSNYFVLIPPVNILIADLKLNELFIELLKLRQIVLYA